MGVSILSDGVCNPFSVRPVADDDLIWRALFSWNTHFKIRLFALLLTLRIFFSTNELVNFEKGSISGKVCYPKDTKFYFISHS